MEWEKDGEFLLFSKHDLELFLDVIASSGDNLLQSFLPRVKHVGETLLAALPRHPGHLSPHGHLHIVVGVELCARQAPLEGGEGPKITRGKIR